MRRPEILREQGLANGITEPFVCEITAWCAELGEHPAELFERALAIERRLPCCNSR